MIAYMFVCLINITCIYLKQILYFQKKNIYYSAEIKFFLELKEEEKESKILKNKIERIKIFIFIIVYNLHFC